MYIPKYFTVAECFPPHIVRLWGTAAWSVYDERILRTADLLRQEFGPMACNTGGMTQCGFRTNSPAGSRSQHQYGRALDLHPRLITAEEVRGFIIESQWEPWSEHITFLETDISWLHIDCRNWDKVTFGIQLWSPKNG